VPPGADPLGECGGAGQRCCIPASDGQRCYDGGCCVGNACVAAGDSCETGGIPGTCGAGSCGDCGGVGQPCCPFMGTEQCTAGGAVCQDGACIECGDASEPCCFAGKCHGASLSCAGTTCAPCGGPTEICCTYYPAPANACDGGGCCFVGTCVGDGQDPCGCQAGECTSCGAVGLPCCEGNVCAASECLMGQCGFDDG
jgi:hypothetical protein